MDIDDRGPQLVAGRFAMRVTNIGVIGNAFFNRGLSFDPSFEFPQGSGFELLEHAELWVGAITEAGERRVSGGPMLEWRPSLAPDDRVQASWAGDLRSRALFDDDADGRTDEDPLNGSDDDGDGRIDEDFGHSAQQLLAAGYRDDRPEAVNYVYPSGEPHQPLGLAVHQETYAWSVPDADAFAGLHFVVTNRGTQVLRSLYLGFLANLDSRQRSESAGHLNDRVQFMKVSHLFDDGISLTSTRGIDSMYIFCETRVEANLPAVLDAASGRHPCAAVVPLSHTTDPLALLTNFAFPGVERAHSMARAPGRDTTFRFLVLAADLPPGQGGVPILDGDRYAALSGAILEALPDRVGDAVVLLSCGPFAYLQPGQSISMDLALVAGEDPDSLTAHSEEAMVVYRGLRLNLLPDSSQTRPLPMYDVGETGLSGHEQCYEPPPGITFTYDPHCPDKFYRDPRYYAPIHPRPRTTPPNPVPNEALYEPGRCVWSDLDCDACTGYDGKETILRWASAAAVPPKPSQRSSPRDHEVEIAWDNMPEVLLDAGVVGPEGFRFTGYRVYRLSDWRRSSILPPPDRWSLIAAFGADTASGQQLLRSVTDSTMAPVETIYGRQHYPVGRYRFSDGAVHNGFDYIYVVTTVAERRSFLDGAWRVQRIESPRAASIDSIVVPQIGARTTRSPVWVVPNPLRARVEWDRPPVPGDALARHIDFFGLPRARATIRIYTVAGDLVAQLEHDGRAGDGQASWDLISRNGQEVESGIYLFTVSSPAGHFVGRFVIIR